MASHFLVQRRDSSFRDFDGVAEEPQQAQWVWMRLGEHFGHDPTVHIRQTTIDTVMAYR
jgi:hypothetical protein